MMKVRIDPLPSMLADTDRISQVFTNLLENAIKYTPLGGSVMLTARAGSGEVIVAVADPVAASPPKICRASLNDSIEWIKRDLAKAMGSAWRSPKTLCRRTADRSESRARWGAARASQCACLPRAVTTPPWSAKNHDSN